MIINQFNRRGGIIKKKKKGIKIPFYRYNELIRAPQLRVVSPDGSSKVMTKEEALKKAEDLGLDLVEVASGTKPPVAKIIDHGKFKYELEKKMKEAKKHQKNIVVKEVRMRPSIGEHDYQIKMNHVKEFFEHQNKVKFIIFFRGREITHAELGMQMAERIKEDLKNLAILENMPRLEGRIIALVFSPSPQGKKKSTKGDTNAKNKDQD